MSVSDGPVVDALIHLRSFCSAPVFTCVQKSGRLWWPLPIGGVWAFIQSQIVGRSTMMCFGCKTWFLELIFTGYILLS